MSKAFRADRGLIIVRALVSGPGGQRRVRLALDTGATATVLSAAILLAIGYDPAAAPDRVQMTTGSGIEFVPRLLIQRVRALEQERTNFRIVAHTLPPSAAIDGLLGLDFLRGRRLVLDFQIGQITLE